MLKKLLKLAIPIILATFFLTVLIARGASIFQGSQGGTGYATTTAGNIGKCLSVGTNSPLAYTFSGCAGGGSGVTSVDMTVPTGLSVSGNPITTAGTLALSYATGYSGVLTATSTNLNNLYNNILSRLIVSTSTNGSGISISTSTNSLILNIPTASASLTGQLSTTDWNTFNSKQPAGSYITASSTIIAGGIATYSPSVTFATSSDTNIGQQWVCGASTCTDTSLWIGTLADGRIASAATWNAKQAALVSGTNIKTINGNSLLGSGDLVVSGGSNFWSTSTNSTYNNFGYQVGINSSTPNANLVIQGSSTAPTLPILNVASSTGASLFTVLANGNVGIGTATPATALSIGSGQIVTPNGSNSLPSYGFFNQANTGMYLVSPGNLGFTVNGTQNVQMDGINMFSPNANGFMFKSQTSDSLSAPTIIPDRSQSSTGFAAGTAGNINAIINGSEIMRWTATGVGIGTSTPASKLVIDGGSAAVQADITTTGSNTASFLTIGNGSGSSAIGMPNANLQFRIGGAGVGVGGTSVMVMSTTGLAINNGGGSAGTGNGLIVGSGNVGFGTTTPSTRLSVTGTSAIDPFNISSTSGTSLLRVTQAGNVGIGTTAPTTTLFVQGQSGTNPFVIASSTGTAMLTLGQNGSTTLSSLGTGLVRSSSGSLYTDASTYLTAAVVSLNGLSGASQTFATTTGGTQWTITSSGTVHTWNIPSSPSFTGTTTLSGALLIPVAPISVLGTSGQIAVNTTANTLTFNSGGTQLYLNPEHLLYPFYIENPASNEDIGLWVANATTTITKVLCVNKGTLDSANVNLVWDNSRQTSTTTTASKLFTSFTACAATTTPISLTLTGSTTVNTLQSLRFITSTASTSGLTLTIFGRDNQ